MAKTVDKAIQDYINIKDQRDVLRQQYTDADERLKTIQAKIEAFLLEEAERAGVSSFSTTEGTAFKKVKTLYNVSDGEVFYRWVNETGEAEMLQKRLSPDAVKSFVEETGDLPPGVSMVNELVIQIRRK